MQIVHLLLADLLWIALVLLTVQAPAKNFESYDAVIYYSSRLRPFLGRRKFPARKSEFIKLLAPPI